MAIKKAKTARFRAVFARQFYDAFKLLDQTDELPAG
jgi:hypothetical protein